MDQTTAYEEFFDRFYKDNSALKGAVESKPEVKSAIIMDINVWFRKRNTTPLGLEQFLVKVRDEFEANNPKLIKKYVKK